MIVNSFQPLTIITKCSILDVAVVLAPSLAALHEFLSWDAHVNNLCKKLAQTNGILSKLRHYVPQTTCISVYFSLFYGSLAWQFASKTKLIESSLCKRNVYP